MKKFLIVMSICLFSQLCLYAQVGEAFDGKHDSKFGVGLSLINKDIGLLISGDFGRNNFLSTFFTLQQYKTEEINSSLYENVHLDLGVRLHFSELLKGNEKNDFYIGNGIGILGAFSVGGHIGWYRSISKNFGINGVIGLSKFYANLDSNSGLKPRVQVAFIWN